MSLCKPSRRADRRAGNGYCYVKLFRDVLKNKCNVTETRRIFGKFPRLRDVVLQLARVASSDCYVHDIYFTGLDIYHVCDHSLILLSSLVIRHMFSEALIGGYDIGDDKALQQSEFARRLGSLAAIGSKDTKQLLSTAASVHVNKQLVDENSSLMSFIQSSAYDASKCRRINLPYAMSPLELSHLQETHPEYSLINSGGGHHCHAVAGNSRICSMEVLLDMIDYRKNMPPLYGEDVAVVDIGGDYVCHVRQNRLNVHCDTPILTPRDSARETIRRTALTSMLAKGTITKDTFDRLTGNKACKQRCMKRAEHCNVTCTYVIINHAQYDISHEDLAQAFDNHKPRVAVSAIHFDPRIFTQDEFVNEDLKVRVVVSGSEKCRKIHFDFAGDSSFSYSHDYNEYVKTVTATHLVTKTGRCYVVERAGIRGPTLYLRYVYCEVQPEMPREEFRFSFWLDAKDETLIVSTWQFQTGYYRDSKFVQYGEESGSGRFLRKHIEVSKKLYELIMANCIRASERSFNLTEMLSAAISFNTRLTINGQDVRTDRDRLDTESLVALVVACYCVAYVVRYGAGKTIECFVNQEKAKRESNHLGFLSLCGHAVDALFSGETIKRKWNTFVEYLSSKKENKDMTFKISSSVRVVTVEEHVAIIAGYEHHIGEAVLSTDSGEVDLLDIRNVLEVQYVDGKLLGKPKTTIAADAVVVASKPPPSVISSNTIVRSDRRSNVAKKKLTNKIVRAMSHISDSAPLSQHAHDALKEMRRDPGDDCGSLHTVKMLGDGRCAYYAMLHCVGLEGTHDDVTALRRILLATCPAELLEMNKNLFLNDFEDRESWGTTDNFGLFSRMVDSKLCVHAVTDSGDLKATAYSMHTAARNGTMHVKWMAIGPGHVDMYEGENFLLDTEGRTATFVDKVLDLIWKTKGSKKVMYDTTSNLPSHRFLNRSGLKLVSILVTYQRHLITSEPVLDLCGAPGGFATVLAQVNADYDMLSGPAIKYDDSIRGTKLDVDILASDALQKVPDRKYALILADGADETSYKDDTILVAEINVIQARLAPGGNCVLKVSNIFAHKSTYQPFIGQFSTVHFVKPDFSLVGNTEVYLVCLGFGQEHVSVLGESNARAMIIRGVLTYYNALVDDKDLSNSKATQCLIDVLTAGISGQQWREPRLQAGGIVSSKEIAVEEIPLLVMNCPTSLTDSLDSTAFVEECVTCPSNSLDSTAFDNLVLRIEDESESVDAPAATNAAIEVPVGKLISIDSASTVKVGTGKRLIKVPTDDGNESEEEDQEVVVDDKLFERYLQQQKPVIRRGEGKPNIVDKFKKLFGSKPKKCKRVTVKRTQRFGSTAERVIVAGGRTPQGRTLNSTSKHVIRHETAVETEVASHVLCREVGTDMNGVIIHTKHKPVILPRKPSVEFKSVGVGTELLYESVRAGSPISSESGISVGTVSEEEQEPVSVAATVVCKSGVEERQELKSVTAVTVREPGTEVVAVPTCLLAETLNKIEKVNLPENEPIRATALFTAVRHLKQDVLFSYAWKDGKNYRLSKCFKHLTGRSHLSATDLCKMNLITRLSNGVTVYGLDVVGVFVLLFRLDG